MKKVTIAAIAAMVLVTTGASAGTIEDATASAANAAMNFKTTVGTGFANGGGESGVALMLSLAPAEAENAVDWSLTGEFSTGYSAATAKASWLSMGMAQGYVGGGYLSAKGNITSSSDLGAAGIGSSGTGVGDAGVVVGTALGGGSIVDPEFSTVASDKFSENGGFGILGIAAGFDVAGTKLIADAGYRFGGIKGPTASLGVSKKFGNEFWSKEFGLKVGVEKIKSDIEDINRVAMYGTISF